MNRSARPGPAHARPIPGRRTPARPGWRTPSSPCSSWTASGWSSTTAATGTDSRSAVIAGIRSAAAVGITSAIRASTPSSLAIRRARRNASGLTAIVVSTGPPTVAPAGSTSRRRLQASVPGAATASPASAHASAASTPAPPPLDTIATRPPAGIGWDAISAAASSSSPRLVVAIIRPARGQPPGVHGQDRDLGGHPARGPGEPARAAEGFQVKHGQLGGVVRLPAHQHVVGGDIEHAADGDERRGPDAQPGKVLKHRHADPAGLGDQAGLASGRVVPGEGSIQPDPRHRDAEAARACQPHARPAAGLEQAGFLRRREVRGDHYQRSGAAIPAFARHVQDACRWHRRHHQVGGLGQRGDGRDARDAFDGAGMRIDRVQGAPETGVADVEQDHPADRSGLMAGADHRSRPGRQQRFQAGHSRAFLPAGHRVQVRASLAEGRALRDRHG
jgi:hypothetical protein